MRPERRQWGPAIDISDAELVADVFRGLQELVPGVSVAVAQYGTETEVTSLTVTVQGWSRLSAWLEATETSLADAVAALRREGWITTGAERAAAYELLRKLQAHHHAWSRFVDPDAADLIELVADL